MLLSTGFSSNSRASRYLDTIRALAALAVVVGHVQGLFFVYKTSVGAQHSLLRFIYSNADIGHQAVMVFFVLSGYLISGSIFKGINKGRFTWSDYLISRLTRLYVVLVPALFLGYVWDHIGMHLWGSGGVYSGLSVDKHVLGFDVAQRSTLRVMFFNLLFLQQIHVPTFGSNGPLWSLSYEFWYYIIFPLGIKAIISKSTLKKLTYSAAIIALCSLVPRSIMVYFGVWLLGVAIHFVPRTWLNSKKVLTGLSAVSLIMIITAILVHNVVSNGEEFNAKADYLVGIAVALGVYTVSGLSDAVVDKTNSISKEFAGFSYTLYLVHFPLLVFVHAALVANGIHKLSPTPITVTIWLCIVLLCLLYAWAISLCTERNTTIIRSWVNVKYKIITSTLMRIFKVQKTILLSTRSKQ